MYDPLGKRILDVLCALLALVVLSPILALTSALIWLEDRHSPLYKQGRVGQHQERFTILKFRSMHVNTSEISSRALAAPAVTRVGRIIRRLNVDELPQLVNILVGDMSVVGPRPALASQSELIAAREVRGVYSAVPGLTGLAQVESYDDMPESEKADKDALYAHRVTLFGDVRIIARTVGYLFKRPPKY